MILLKCKTFSGLMMTIMKNRSMNQGNNGGGCPGKRYLYPSHERIAVSAGNRNTHIHSDCLPWQFQSGCR